MLILDFCLSRWRVHAAIAWISIAFAAGCNNYIPIEVTVINIQTGLPQPGLKLRPYYDQIHYHSGKLAWVDEDWRTSDADGKAILPVTIDLYFQHPDEAGGYYRCRADPSIIIDNTNFYLQYGGWEKMLDREKLRRATGVTNQANPFQMKLPVEPHAPLPND
jgi:hypothetical protein